MRHIVLLFIAIIAFTPNLAQAEQKIAVVDVQRLLTQSEAAKDIQSQLEKQRKTFLDELGKKEQDLREKQTKLVEDRTSLEKEEFAKRAREFETQLVETRGMAQSQKAKLDRAASEAMQSLRLELVKVVQDIADDNDYALVLSAQNVVVGKKDMDVSDEAMKRLNAAIKEIPLKIK